MEDEIKGLWVKKTIKYIILAILIIIIIVLFIFLSGKGNNTKIQTYFKNNHYKLNKDTWNKTSTKNIDNKQITTNYIYNAKLNIFTKETTTTTDNTRLSFSSQYNGKNELNINMGYIVIGKNHCRSFHTITYNYKTQDFTCNLTTAEGKCEIMCDKAKKEAEDFAKEIQPIIKEAKLPHNIF